MMRRKDITEELEVRSIDVAGLRMNVATAGAGAAVLLVHGIPHTWFLWRRVMATLAQHYYVIAPDLRGLGASQRAQSGFDVATVAADLRELLDVLGVADVAAIGIDLGVQTAFMLAASAPERVRGLVLMEGLVGALPGAESFLSRGVPWWFGFHSVPGLPEALVVGREDVYIDYFLSNGSYQRRGIDPEARGAFIHAYSGHESIRCLCEHYRAMPQSALQIADITRARRLDVPTLAIAGGVIGDALAGQLASVTTRLSLAAVEGAAHIIPEDQPERLLALVEPFLVSLGEPSG